MAKAQGKTHLITSQIEHHAILHTAEKLEKQASRSPTCPWTPTAWWIPRRWRAAITDKTGLVSIMFANNEIGTIEPIAAIGAICREKGVPLSHRRGTSRRRGSDRCGGQNIDLLSMSAHKIYGPKGVGLLYIRKGVRIANLINGGAQERAAARAPRNARHHRPGQGDGAGHGRLRREQRPPDADARRAVGPHRGGDSPMSSLNGHRTERLPSNLNVSFA